MKIDKPLSEKYRPSLWVAGITQVFAIALSALMFDNGQTLQTLAIAMIPFWVITFVIVSRRPNSPTKPDLLAIRWGFVLCAILVGLFRFLLSK